MLKPQRVAAVLVVLLACSGCLTANLWGLGSHRGPFAKFGRRSGTVARVVTTPVALLADATVGVLLLWLASDDDDEVPSYRDGKRRRRDRKPRTVRCAK